MQTLRNLIVHTVRIFTRQYAGNVHTIFKIQLSLVRSYLVGITVDKVLLDRFYTLRANLQSINQSRILMLFPVLNYRLPSNYGQQKLRVRLNPRSHQSAKN